MSNSRLKDRAWRANPAAAYIHFDPVPTYTPRPPAQSMDHHGQYIRLLRGMAPVYTEPQSSGDVFGSRWSQVRETTGQYGQPMPFVDGTTAQTLLMCKSMRCMHTTSQPRRHIPLFPPHDGLTVRDYIAGLRRTAAAARYVGYRDEPKTQPYAGTRASAMAAPPPWPPTGCDQRQPWENYVKTKEYWTGFFEKKSPSAGSSPLPPIERATDFDNNACGCFAGGHMRSE